MESCVVRSMKLYNFKTKIPVSNMVMSILIQGYEILLNAFQRFSVTRRYRILNDSGTLKCGSN